MCSKMGPLSRYASLTGCRAAAFQQSSCLAGPSRLPAQSSFGTAQFGTARTYSTTSKKAPLAEKPKVSSRLKTLPRPSPQFTIRGTSLDLALGNAKARNANFGAADVERLEVVNARIAEILPDLHTLGQQQKALSAEIESLALQKSKIQKSKTLDEDASSREAELSRLDVAIADAARAIKETVKPQHSELVSEHQALEAESNALRLRAPNSTHRNVPHGPESAALIKGVGGNVNMLPPSMEDAFREARARTHGPAIPLASLPALENGQPDKARDHLLVAEQLGWMDKEAARLVAGSPSWPFLAGPLALLEHALVAYAMHMALNSGFEPMTVPDVVRRDILDRTGFSPRDGSGGQIFWLSEDGAPSKKVHNGEDADELALAGTAEVPLAGFCAGKTFRQDALPLKLVATSHAFRAEAGARGLESRGLYRVHQFTKVEMFVVCKAKEENSESFSSNMLEDLRRIQERIIRELGVPYRVLDMPTQELGASAHRKYDIEAWMPGRGSWGEISSASLCTDYQSRRLHITHETSSGKRTFAETLNGTAAAVPRLVVALLENYGVDSYTNRIRLPAILQRFWLGDINSVEWVGAVESGNISTAEARADRHVSPATSTPTRQGGALRSSIVRVREAAQRSGVDPASMVLSFLVLHELTAIIPVVLLFFALWSLGAGESVAAWLQETADARGPGSEQSTEESGIGSQMRKYLQSYMDEALLRAERVGRRYGLFGFEKGSNVDASAAPTIDKVALAGTFANAVAAYAIVKILLPVRIAACVALAAPFARVCINPIKRVFTRTRSKPTKQ